MERRVWGFMGEFREGRCYSVHAGEVGEWHHARGRSGLDIEDDPDRWVPPVSGERKKKKEKGRGCAGEGRLGWLLGCLPRVGPVRPLLPFFVSFLFLIFGLLILVWYLRFIFVWI
jgi:hypothetical protein